MLRNSEAWSSMTSSFVAWRLFYAGDESGKAEIVQVLLFFRGVITCPTCDSNVVLKTCAFNDCLWKYDGVKGSGEYATCDWKQAGHQYERFSSGGQALKRPLTLFRPSFCRVP